MAFIDPEFEAMLDRKPILTGPFRPTGGRILVRPDGEDLKRTGSIHLVEQKLPTMGLVVATSDCIDKRGRRIPCEVRPGDRVIFDKKSTMPLEIDGIEHRLLHQKFVLAKLEPNYDMSEEGL